MIQWEDTSNAIPIRSWCADIDETTRTQARNLANHPVVKEHVSLMPDAHGGYGMPIGGVIACDNAVIPNAVGVDIGCGMAAVQTSLEAGAFYDKACLRRLTEAIKARIPVGEGKHRKDPIPWDGFDLWRGGFSSDPPAWWSEAKELLDRCNLGTLGGGNHFIEIQEGQDRQVWLMLHSGSRNLGMRVASHYHKEARSITGAGLPDPDLAYLPADSLLGAAYIRDMGHALSYAKENRRLMMLGLKEIFADFFPEAAFLAEINIHHNYAARETHGGASYWIHRKGATSAGKGEAGIIPGSMGTFSYIVEGLGNPQSFMSCSHGAGRKMSRSAANKQLTLEACEQAMGDVVYDRFGFSRSRGEGGKKSRDFSEAPQAYKDIEAVIEAERDLVEPKVRLRPLAVVKG
ncbi:MAG: RtcB family protein [Spirochaetaceae bacterium]|jgi:tRNA-splicing ligase RtcB|nr:RtcB family protein [Spirochaetaceae bacterium]